MDSKRSIIRRSKFALHAICTADNVEWKQLLEEKICVISQTPILYGDLYCECEKCKTVMHLESLILLYGYDNGWDPKCPVCRNTFYGIPKLYYNVIDTAEIMGITFVVGTLCYGFYEFLRNIKK